MGTWGRQECRLDRRTSYSILFYRLLSLLASQPFLFFAWKKKHLVREEKKKKKKKKEEAEEVKDEEEEEEEEPTEELDKIMVPSGTGGGFGFPGTSKLMEAAQVVVSIVLLITHVWDVLALVIVKITRRMAQS